MTRRWFPIQYSLRTVLSFSIVAGVALCWFAPQLRGAFERYFQSAPSVPFHTSSPGGLEQVWTSFAAMHEHYVQRFVESEGFGFSRVLRLDDPSLRLLMVNGQPYSARRMELISLNAGSTPYAYINEIGNPRKDSLLGSARRQLSDFERRAVATIARGQTAVFNGDQTEPVVVGAIRARQQCLECHSAKLGELLGCMTYVLEPARPVVRLPLVQR